MPGKSPAGLLLGSFGTMFSYIVVRSIKLIQ
jgi:hypothetical protein